MAEIKRHSILIIDDDEDYLEILQRGLSNEFAITTISGFQNLKKEIYGLRPSLIMLDHHLGGKNPEEVLDFIHSLDFLQGIPLYLISANDGGKKLASEYNLEGFMVKPTSIKGVRDMLNSVLSRIGHQWKNEGSGLRENPLWKFKNLYLCAFFFYLD